MDNQLYGMAELQQLVKLMQNSGCGYLKDRANLLERYIAQLIAKEVTRAEFNIMISDFIELKNITIPNTYEGNNKRGKIFELAKRILPRFGGVP